MPVYKGSAEVTSGNLHKGSTEIQNGYKATDPFYVNAAVISFIDYPGVTPNPKTFTGSPGATISPAAQVQWSISAPSGQAYENTPTISGVVSPFTSSVASNGSGFGSTNSTIATFTVNKPGTYPSSAISSDYGNVTTSTPTSTVNTATLTNNPNYSGPYSSGGGSGFGSALSGSISGNAIRNDGAGGSGTGCSAGTNGIINWNVTDSGGSNYANGNAGGASSVGVSLAPGTYQTGPNTTVANQWSGSMAFTPANSNTYCTAPYNHACWTYSATQSGGIGGGTFTYNPNPGSRYWCNIYGNGFNNLLRCSTGPAGATYGMVTAFEVSGSSTHNGVCYVTYTL